MEPGYGPIFALILGNAAFMIPLFLWNRAESRTDMRHMDAKLDSNRDLIRAVHQESAEKQESNRELIRTIHQETRDLIIFIQSDIRDFHGSFVHKKEQENISI